MEKRNYKPVRLSDSLKGINKSLVNRFGKVDYVVHSKWTEIVGTFFAQHSQPEKITNRSLPSEDIKIENQEKILHVNVASAAAIEFQHFQNKIIEKINSFLGYQAIHGIRILQNFTLKDTFASRNKIRNFDNNLFNQKKIEIKDTTQKINDKALEESLLNLGLSIARNEEN